MASSGYVTYPALLSTANGCRLSRHSYDALKLQISDDSSNASVETYVQDEHVSLRDSIAFRIYDHRLYVLIGTNELQIRRVSDLPGTDRLMRPSNLRKLTQRQVRLYKKWSQFLLTGQVYFTGPFACVNRITGASPECHSTVQADRPVPLHRNFIPKETWGFKVCSLGLRRRVGKKIYHVSSRGNVDLVEADDVVYLGSGRLRTIQTPSDSSADDDYIGEESEEDVDDNFCNCAFLVSRYKEIAAKYNLEEFADQVLRDSLQHQITKGGKDENDCTTQVHVCRKYNVPGFMEVTETFCFEAILSATSNASRQGRWMYPIEALRLQELVDFDMKVSSGKYEVIVMNVRRRFILTRREVRKVRDICQLGNCVCEIARAANLSIKEVHGLLLRVPGSHTNHIFGACYANRDGVYTGDRTGSEQGCTCLENSLTLRDVIGVICNQYGKPMDETRSGLYPVIEVRCGYAHICSWSKEDTLLPDGVDLDTKIAGLSGSS